MGELKKRIITTICLGPVVVLLFYLLPAGWFFAFLCLVAVLAVSEITAMTKIRSSWLFMALTIAGMVPLFFGSVPYFLFILGLSPVVFILIRVGNRGRNPDNTNEVIVKEIGALVLSQMFIVLPFYYLFLLKKTGDIYPLILLFAIWLSDILAYFFGKSFGKHPLAPAISPKKTFEGLLGAIVGSMIIVALMSKFMNLRIVEALIAGGVIGILGQTGDIFESAGKRFCGVKDSSSFIPGHGGVLDRMDSFIFTSPFLYYYLNGLK